MKLNNEKTKFDKLRFAVGAVFGAVGLLLIFFSFYFITPLLIGSILVIIGLLIAGSARLASLIYELLS